MNSSRWIDEDGDEDEDGIRNPHGASSKTKRFTCRTCSTGSGSGGSSSRNYLKGDSDRARRKILKNFKNNGHEEYSGHCSRRLKRRRGSYTVRFSENFVQEQEHNVSGITFGGKHYMSSPCLVAHRTPSDCSTGSTGFDPDDLDEEEEVWNLEKRKMIDLKAEMAIPVQQQQKEETNEQKLKTNATEVQTQTQVAMSSLKIFRSKSKSIIETSSKSSPRLVTKSSISRHNVVNILNNNQNDRNNNKIGNGRIQNMTYSRSPPPLKTRRFKTDAIKLYKERSNVRIPYLQKLPAKRQQITVYRIEDEHSDDDEDEGDSEEADEGSDEEGDHDKVGKRSSRTSASTTRTRSTKKLSKNKKRSDEANSSQNPKSTVEDGNDFEVDLYSHSGRSSLKDSFFEQEIKNEQANQKRVSKNETSQPIQEQCFPLPPPPPQCIPQNNGGSMFQPIPPPPPGFCQEIRVNVNQNPPQVTTQMIPCPGSLPQQPCPPPQPTECSPPQECNNNTDPNPYQVTSSVQCPNPCVPLQFTCKPTVVYPQQNRQQTSSQCCCQSGSSMFCRLSQDQRIRCQRCRVLSYCRSILGGGCARSLHAGCYAGSRRDSNNNGGLSSSVYVMPPYQIGIDSLDTGKWKSEYSKEFIDWSRERPIADRYRNDICATGIEGKTTRDTAVSAQGSSLGDDGKAQRKEKNKAESPNTVDRAVSASPPAGVWQNEGGGRSSNNGQERDNRRYERQNDNGGWNGQNRDIGPSSGGGYPSGYSFGATQGQMGYSDPYSGCPMEPVNNNLPEQRRYYFQHSGIPPGGGYGGGQPAGAGVSSGASNNNGNKPSEYVFLIGPGGTLISGSSVNNAGTGVSACGYPPAVNYNPGFNGPAGPYGNMNETGYPPPGVITGGPFPYPSDGYGKFSNANNSHCATSNAHSSPPSFADKSIGPAEYDEGLDWDKDPYPFFTKGPTQILYCENTDRPAPRGSQIDSNRGSNLQTKQSNLGYRHPHEGHVHYAMENQRSFPYGGPVGNLPSGHPHESNNNRGFIIPGSVPGAWRTSNPLSRVGAYGGGPQSMVRGPQYFPGANQFYVGNWGSSLVRPGQQQYPRNVQETDIGSGPGPWGAWGKDWVNRNGPFKKLGNDKPPPTTGEPNESETSWEDASEDGSYQESHSGKGHIKGSKFSSKSGTSGSDKSRKSTTTTASGPDHTDSEITDEDKKKGKGQLKKQKPGTPSKAKTTKSPQVKDKAADPSSPSPSKSKVALKAKPSKEQTTKNKVPSKEQLAKANASTPSLPSKGAASKTKVSPKGGSPAKANGDGKAKTPLQVSPKKLPTKTNPKKNEDGAGSNASSTTQFVMVKTTTIKRKSVIKVDSNSEDEHIKPKTGANSNNPSATKLAAGKPGTATKALANPKGNKKPATKPDSQSPAAAPSSASKAQKPDTPKGKAVPTPISGGKDGGNSSVRDRKPEDADGSGGDVLIKKTTTRKKVIAKKEPELEGNNEKPPISAGKSPTAGKEEAKVKAVTEKAPHSVNNKNSGDEHKQTEKKDTGNKKPPENNNKESQEKSSESKKHSQDSKASEPTTSSGKSENESGTTESSGSSMILVKKTTVVKKLKTIQEDNEGGTTTDFSEPPTPPSTPRAKRTQPAKLALTAKKKYE